MIGWQGLRMMGEWGYVCDYKTVFNSTAQPLWGTKDGEKFVKQSTFHIILQSLLCQKQTKKDSSSTDQLLTLPPEIHFRAYLCPILASVFIWAPPETWNETEGSRNKPGRINSHCNFDSTSSQKCPAWNRKHLKTTAIRKINWESCSYQVGTTHLTGFLLQTVFLTKVSAAASKMWGGVQEKKFKWCFLCDSPSQSS